MLSGSSMWVFRKYSSRCYKTAEVIALQNYGCTYISASRLQSKDFMHQVVSKVVLRGLLDPELIVYPDESG
jgi:hypothetical protein